MRSHLQKMHDSIKTWKKYTRQNQYNAKTSCEPAQNHGIKQKVKDCCYLISFVPSFLVALIHKMAKASPLKCGSQGLMLPVVARRSPFNSCVLCACGLHLQQILDADGWALVVVLYTVLSDLLAGRCL